jgi:hypothetical protein
MESVVLGQPREEQNVVEVMDAGVGAHCRDFGASVELLCDLIVDAEDRDFADRAE